MNSQRGFSSLTVVAILALLGAGFYIGITYQKSNISNVTLLQSPKPSVVPTSEPTPSSNKNLAFTPSPTPTLTQSSGNTSDSNAPTSIKVASPNGGERLKVGDSMHITWSSNNLNKNGSCIITLVYDNGSKSTAWVPVNTPQGFFDWKLNSDSGDHQVKVDIDCYDSNQTNVHDQSDNFFTVTN